MKTLLSKVFNAPINLCICLYLGCRIFGIYLKDEGVYKKYMGVLHKLDDVFEGKAMLLSFNIAHLTEEQKEKMVAILQKHLSGDSSE